MVNHVVSFKLKDFPVEEKIALANEFKSLLEGLKTKIDELKFIEVGINHDLTSANYDFVLISHFDSLEALECYRVHPEHQKVGKRIVEATVSRAAVDFLF